MAPAISLPQAAGLAFDNLHIKWASNNLKASLTLFWQTALPQFPESDFEVHPVSNWFVLIAALATPMALTNVPIEQLTQASQYVYRLCWMADALAQAGLITGAQAAFLLATYNTLIG